MLGHAWLVTALNPKGITFFVAFLPQFLDRNGDFWTQMLIFEATFICLAFANAIGYALVASRARTLVQQRARRRNVQSHRRHIADRRRRRRCRRTQLAIRTSDRNSLVRRGGREWTSISTTSSAS